ncbi:MAG: hypothetical protein A2504_16410 [Bdellovibrionales bacterium RIFOXYD12_FULL_39_22]|nr:MAG: hypothetical protein A2385_10065 [Bdellovibrionales bacterium RIFOXYB1_FULL_39_21]OFZ45445.1 MAG: hypothetical protein A2404_01310 [Bdellovibrionales bacterium RIFOXYC1_FULL_39_130]OFZ74648.1 MAG: hypothetical protein A2560_09635 [Bdellovibrionales bacterium RIFOXYD1_FULL_39_84]OFZ92957.1 MAG: hypothetical protein A2504_16410 [Bdellovibrionales bacterium RIFOXYD12_FULL_39_22]HLE12808.1 helix-turn-helix domain-containing protein [Bacteriovoracaceae bacterium]
MSEGILDLDYKVSSKRYSGVPESKDDGEFFYNRIWRVRDVAKYLGCSVGHIYNLVASEKIPKKKKGGLLFFIPNEILSWILEGEKYE